MTESHKTKYGVDVAITRADDLDKRMLTGAQSKGVSSVLDVGCGAGGQSFRLVALGVSVLAIDIQDFSSEFIQFRGAHNLSEGALRFIYDDVLNIETYIKSKTFESCCFQRAIHYLQYKDAVRVLKIIRGHVNGSLYISVSGLESAIGENYADSKKPASERFCELDAESAQVFDINKPLCLYTKSEFEGLLKESGWVVQERWTSAFGNHKAVCTPKA